MKKIALAVFGLALLAPIGSHAASGNWVKLRPDALECVNRPALHVNYEGRTLFGKLGGAYPRAHECAALKVAALDSQRALFMDVDTGDLRLDDEKFFQPEQPPALTEHEVRLESPAELECENPIVFHVNYRGETLFSTFGGALPLARRCEAVRLPAKDAGVAVVLDTSSGELRPALGFFRHSD